MKNLLFVLLLMFFSCQKSDVIPEPVPIKSKNVNLESMNAFILTCEYLPKTFILQPVVKFKTNTGYIGLERPTIDEILTLIKQNSIYKITIYGSNSCWTTDLCAECKKLYLNYEFLDVNEVTDK